MLLLSSQIDSRGGRDAARAERDPSLVDVRTRAGTADGETGVLVGAATDHAPSRCFGAHRLSSKKDGQDDRADRKEGENDEGVDEEEEEVLHAGTFDGRLLIFSSISRRRDAFNRSTSSCRAFRSVEVMPALRRPARAAKLT